MLKNIFKDERGGVSVMALCLTFLLSLLLIIYIQQNRLDSLKLEERSKLYLCLKTITGETRIHIKKMQKYNKGIKMANYGKYIAILFPQLAPIATSAKTVKNTLQKLQYLDQFSLLNKIRKLNNKNCPLNPSLLITPYGPPIKRNLDGTAKIRKKKWHIYLKQNQLILLATLQAKDQLQIGVQEISTTSALAQLKQSFGSLF